MDINRASLQARYLTSTKTTIAYLPYTYASSYDFFADSGTSSCYVCLYSERNHTNLAVSRNVSALRIAEELMGYNSVELMVHSLKMEMVVSLVQTDFSKRPGINWSTNRRVLSPI